MLAKCGRARRAAIALVGALLAGAVALAGVSSAPSAAWAMMAGDASDSSQSSSEQVQGQGEVVGTSEYDGQPAAAEEGEQLGMMPRLHRLTGQTIAAEGDGGLTTEGVGAVFPNLLQVSTTPTSINTGIECTNNDFCLIDPCTCGKPDAWGHCACGGFRVTVPTVTITVDDESIAKTVEMFGQTWLVPVSPGTTTVTITAELVHFKSASYSFNVQVAPFGAMDLLLIVAVLLVMAGLAAAVVLVARLAIRLVRKRLAERRAWIARGEQLKNDYPLTWRAKLSSERYASRHGGKARRLGVRLPFLHDFLFSMRSALPVLLAGLAAFAVLVPASTSLVEDFSVFNVNYTHQQLKYQLYAQQLAPFVNAACVVYGAVLAVVLFRFLLVKQATTAFFSIGLSRVKLFASRYLAGALCIVAGIGVPFAISLALNMAALEAYWGQVPEFFYVTCGYILVALIAFSLSCIATVRSGTLFEALSFSAALLMSVTVVLWGVGVLAEHLLAGNAAGVAMYNQSASVEPSFLESLARMNPLLFFAEEGATHQFFMALHPVYYPQLGDWRYLVIWFGIFLVLSAFAALELCQRNGEQAEMAGKAPVLSLFSVAVAGLAVFAAFVALLGEVDIAVALVVAAAAFVLVSLLLLFGPLRGRTARRTTLACVGGELAAMVAVAAVVATGAFGFAGYVPQSDQIASVEVSYTGAPSYLTQGFSGVSTGASYYFTSVRSYEDESSIETIRTVHESLVASAKSPFHTDAEDFQNTVVPYDVVIRYRMKDGAEVVRYYDRATVGELEAMLALDDDPHGKALEAAVITGNTDALTEEEKSALSESPSYNAYRAGSVYLADASLGNATAIECTDQQRAALLEALAADLASLDAAQRYGTDDPVVGVLMFSLSPEIDVDSFGYSFSNSLTYLTRAWTNTVGLLESMGYAETLTPLEAEDVVELTLVADDPSASSGEGSSPVSRYFMAYRSEDADWFWTDVPDGGQAVTVADSDEIAQAVSDIRQGCFMGGGYYVRATLAEGEGYAYFYLPTESVPSYVE